MPARFVGSSLVKEKVYTWSIDPPPEPPTLLQIFSFSIHCIISCLLMGFFSPFQSSFVYNMSMLINWFIPFTSSEVRQVCVTHGKTACEVLECNFSWKKIQRKVDTIEVGHTVYDSIRDCLQSAACKPVN